jgi:hypothetical protein
MKNQLVEIRQRANSFTRQLKSDQDFTMHPKSFKMFSPRKNQITDEWITGLTKEEEVKFGEKLRKDLSPTSDYWRDLSIMLVNGKTPITFNLNNTEQLIRYKCAVANDEIAESKDQLDDPEYKINDCFLYVYDPIGDVERESLLEVIKDEITALILRMRLQKEKSMLVCAKMNIPFNEEYTATQFYQMLKTKLKSLVKMEHLEKFKEVLESPMDSLHVEYLVNKEL